MKYVVASISRLLKITGLFCKRALSKRLYPAKETYDFKEPTNRSHSIVERWVYGVVVTQVYCVVVMCVYEVVETWGYGVVVTCVYEVVVTQVY